MTLYYNKTLPPPTSIHIAHPDTWWMCICSRKVYKRSSMKEDENTLLVYFPGAPDCSPAVPGFDPSLGQIRHPQPCRPSLGKRTRVPRTCNRCGSAVQTSAEEEEDCPGGTEITAVKAVVRCHPVKFIRDGLSKCGRLKMDV